MWKKDYDRVIALAKGALSSTTVQGIQAESLYILARVHHVRDEMEKAHTFYERACNLAPDLSPARFGLAQTLIWDETYDEAAGHLQLVVGKSPSATDAHATLGLLGVKSGKDRKGAFSNIKKAIDLDPANADLVLLEALALQQQESDYPLALERYQKAVELMDTQGDSPPWTVLTNMGVLCHETKNHDEASSCYEKAMVALEKDADAAVKASLENEYDFIHHKDNHLFWEYLDTGVVCTQIQTDESKSTWTLEEECSHIKVGDHVQLGDVFSSEIEEINGTELKLKDKHVSPASEEANEEGEGDKEESVNPKMKLAVKRTNGRLGIDSAISIAFNFARLHEVVGRTLAAVELHKAIVKRHPSYVNSYLRLACIARDCGSLANCSEWLKSACAVAPGNPEVLTLVGNLHLSLCDWKPAQGVFNQLLEQKIPNVEAYSMLCLGNVYFNNLKTPDRYAKHLQYAADYYRRILYKDNANAFAANGLGTVMAEKADLPRAKEIFNQVREISGDSIPDALLNLGHIYLALSKHPEALQMYHSYMERTRSSAAPTSSKSQDEDEAEILLYIAFAYFDWARQTEACNNAKAGPADGHYKKCIEYIEMALKKTKRENIILRYDWCMAKLAAANCVLQKLTRGIRRTAKEVKDALDGLHESLPKVQMMLQWKQEGKKVPVSSTLMNTFITQCKANIESAKSHLSEEIKKEVEASELRELQKMDAMEKSKLKELAQLEVQERVAQEQEAIEMKANMKMQKVGALLEAWENEQTMSQQVSEKKGKKKKGQANPQAEDEDDDGGVDQNATLFDDDSDDDENANDNNNDGNEIPAPESQPPQTEKDLFGDSEGEDDDDNGDDDKVMKEAESAPAAAPSAKELFDEESSSDEELVPANKRGKDDVGGDKDEDAAPQKKRRVAEDSDSD
jgi:RNA polymerase-associated protein CTR9